MSKKLKVMFFLMVVVIAFLGCALISVAVTLGQPAGVSGAGYEAPALNEETAADPATPTTAPEPAESHPLGWSASDEAEAVAYAERSMVYLDEWVVLLDEAMDYNNRMVADPTLIFDLSWVMGYQFVMDDWISHTDKCLAWDIPVAPMSEVDYLLKQSCIQSKASARSLLRGLDGLPDDIDGLIYELGVAVDELDLSNQYMDDSNTRLQEILLITG